METSTTRTLVKSAPELWELADDPERMKVWAAGLTGAAGSIEIEVTHREPKRVLAWRTANDGPFARIAVEMAEKGFGTAVSITAAHDTHNANAGAVLESVLDELGAPERRPFTNV